MRKIKVKTYFRGVYTDSSYNGKLLKIAPATLAHSQSAQAQAHNENIISCTYAINVNVGRSIKTRTIISQYEDRIKACLSLIAKVPFFEVDSLKSERVNGMQVRRPSAKIVFSQPATFSQFTRFARKRHAEKALLFSKAKLSANSLQLWDKASSYVINSAIVKGDIWLVALRWLRKSYDSNASYDKLMAAWIAFNSLFKQLKSALEATYHAAGQKDRKATEEELVNYFVDQRTSLALCKQYVSERLFQLDQLAKKEPELTKFRTGKTKQRTHNLLNALRAGSNSKQVVKALLVVIYAIRNNIFHAEWTYDDEAYEFEVEAAHDLLVSFLSCYFFLEIVGSIPKWDNAIVSSF